MENLILPTDEQVERAKKALDQFEDGFFRNLINGDSTVLAFLVLLLNQDKILGEVAEVRPLPFGPVSATADSIDRAVSEFRQLIEKLAKEKGVETIVEYQEITRIISLAMGRSAGLNVTSDDCDLADADAGLREWYHHKDISYSPLVRDGKRAIQDAQESRVMIHNLTQKLWSAIQRRSPAMSEEEVAAILREGLDVPTADETPHEGTISADGLSWGRKGAEALYGDDARPENPHWSHGAVRVETDDGPMIAITNPSYAEYLAVHNPELLRKSGECNVAEINARVDHEAICAKNALLQHLKIKDSDNGK